MRTVRGLTLDEYVIEINKLKLNAGDNILDYFPRQKIEKVWLRKLSPAGGFLALMNSIDIQY